MRDIAKDFNASAFWAGITAFTWYAFGGVPLLFAVAFGMGLSAAQVSEYEVVSLDAYYRVAAAHRRIADGHVVIAPPADVVHARL